MSSVGGNLAIQNNTLLSDVDGLAALATVAGNVNFASNPALTSYNFV